MEVLRCFGTKRVGSRVDWSMAGSGKSNRNPLFPIYRPRECLARAARKGATLRTSCTEFSAVTCLAGNTHMDDDLADLDRDTLVAEVKRLRAGIREHRDSSGHALCWHHPKLWGLLPEKTDPLPTVPAWPQFLRGCLQYRESLDRQLPAAPRTEGEFQEER